MGPCRSVRTPQRSRVGFTLIELLLVVVLVGILLAVAVPSVGRTINRDRVLRSATVVQGMLDEASQMAARRRSPVVIQYNAGTGALRLIDRQTNQVLRNRLFGPTQDLRATISVTPVDGVTVFPNGRANAALVVTLSGGGSTTTVTRTATGIVRRL